MCIVKVINFRGVSLSLHSKQFNPFILSSYDHQDLACLLIHDLLHTFEFFLFLVADMFYTVQGIE